LIHLKARRARDIEPEWMAMTEETTPSIVAIDDDPSVRKSLDNLFRSVGFEAERFASPQEFKYTEVVVPSMVRDRFSLRSGKKR
jgi:hypothetical protein